MKKALSVLSLAALISAGCISVDEDASAAIQAVRTGHGPEAVAWAEKLATESSYSKNLGLVEAGRVHFLLGDYETANTWLRAAVESAVDRKEGGPKIKLGDVANTALAATVTDDRTRNYYLAPYEINQALEYSILAQEQLGRRADALVDCRLAVYLQEDLAQTYGADLVKEEEKANDTAKSLLTENAASMESVIARTRSSWENPLLWWLTGVLFEAEGETQSAEQSYLRAAAIRPDNAIYAADAARIGKKPSPAAGQAKLVVVVGDGFISQRKGLKVPIPIYTGMSMDIPIYGDEAYVPTQVLVEVEGLSRSAAAPALDLQSLAYRDLKEHLVGIITRNITRAGVQAAAQAAVNRNGNGYAMAGVFVGNLIISAIRKADVRAWATLPMGEQIWCSDAIKPGKRQVTIAIGGTTRTFTVDLKPGQTRIVYVNNL